MLLVGRVYLEYSIASQPPATGTTLRASTPAVARVSPVFFRVRLLAVACCVAASAPALAAVERVPFADGQQGQIVIRTAEKKLYLSLGDGSALRYPIAVGMAGKQWSGAARIDGKYVEPGLVAPGRSKTRQAVLAGRDPARS